MVPNDPRDPQLNMRTKKEIRLDLTDKEKAAKVCHALSSPIRLEILEALADQAYTISQLARKFYLPLSSISMHTRILAEADLIAIVSKPGVHGTRKMCSFTTSDVTFNFFAQNDSAVHHPPVLVNMPIGHYTECEATVPCGIASANFFLRGEDSPLGFFEPDHVDAAILWMSSGFLKYTFPNETLKEGPVKEVEFSFEICSEAPGYNNTWPSDIGFFLNDHLVVTMTLQGDYGGRRGINNPSWWSDTSTQYGELVIIRITEQGCFLNNQRVSDLTIETLGLMDGYRFTMMLRSDPNARYAGGMNLFGSSFGDYSQDIVMKVIYR